MASTGRRGVRSLIELLADEPYRFDGRQAVRVLEMMAPGAVPVGLRSDPEDVPVAFCSSLGSAFPASDIDQIQMSPRPTGGRPVMTVNFFGLGGAFGPLPAGFTELAATRARHGDTAARDFLDIFNHRLVSLMMRSWRLFRLAMEGTSPEKTSFAFYLFALLGLATEGMRNTRGRDARNRLDGLDRSLLGLTGLLNQRPVSLHAVERTLAMHLDLPVYATPLQGAWLQLDVEQRTAIGRSGRNQALGASALVGGRAWDQQAGVLIALGPMGFHQALALLPTGAGFSQIRVLLGFMLGDAFDVRLRLTIRPEDVPASSLGKTGFLRLGWTAWLTSRPSKSPGILTIAVGAASGGSEAPRCTT